MKSPAHLNKKRRSHDEQRTTAFSTVANKVALLLSLCYTWPRIVRSELFLCHKIPQICRIHLSWGSVSTCGHWSLHRIITCIQHGGMTKRFAVIFLFTLPTIRVAKSAWSSSTRKGNTLFLVLLSTRTIA